MYKNECDYNKCQELENSILSKYSFIKRFVIGKTIQNRKILAYTIGSEPRVLLCGAFHGMERITAMMLYRFLDDVSSRFASEEAFAHKLNSGGITIVPMVNPDGVEISLNGIKTAGVQAEFISECLVKSGLPHKKWQANSRGVDINHNFDAGFWEVKKNEIEMGITMQAPTRYGGEYPESERETQAVCQLCRENDYLVSVALHSQGREIYYDYGYNTPLESIYLAQDLEKISGYKVSRPIGIAVGGGFKDWFIEKFHRPAFTIEVGKGENPLPPDSFDSEYPVVSKMLWHILSYALK